MDTVTRSKPVTIAQILFFINAGTWLVLATNMGVGMTRKYPDMAAAYSIISVLMLGNAGAMLVSGWGLKRFPRLALPFAILVLIVNIPLTITDEFGLFDLVTLAIDLVILGILVVNRKRILLKD